MRVKINSQSRAMVKKALQILAEAGTVMGKAVEYDIRAVPLEKAVKRAHEALYDSYILSGKVKITAKKER